jgi:CheY-like chemotaxis protein
VGIPEDDLPRIFDPFYTTKQDGSGLGLTISHSIVAKHGGLLRASSRLGEGSVFSIVLPVSAAPVVGGSGHDDRSPEKFSGDVLVMDDEEIVGKALAEMLKLIGFSVSVCGDGGQAVALYSERLGKGRKFDAVILDLTVPGGKGGLESGREILDLDPSAVLIMSSGYSRDAVMSDPLKFGFQAFISKPFRMSDVRSVFASLRHRGAGRPERSPEP